MAKKKTKKRGKKKAKSAKRSSSRKTKTTKKAKKKTGKRRGPPAGGLDLKRIAAMWRAEGKPGTWQGFIKSHKNIRTGGSSSGSKSKSNKSSSKKGSGKRSRQRAIILRSGSGGGVLTSLTSGLPRLM